MYFKDRQRADALCRIMNRPGGYYKAFYVAHGNVLTLHVRGNPAGPMQMALIDRCALYQFGAIQKEYGHDPRRD